MNLGDFALGKTFDLKFTTRQFSTGAPFTLAGTPAVAAYPDNSTTEITAGITLTVDFDSRTGLNNVRVVATSGNGYAAGVNYALVITAGTVDSVSVVGEVIGSFSIEARSALRPTTADRTLTVESDGMAHADVKEILGADLSGYNATVKLKQLDIQNSAGSALVAKSTGSNGHGIETAGNGTGEGLSATGGATGHGAEFIGGASSGSGIRAAGTAGNSAALTLAGQGSGAGLASAGGTSGPGVSATGGGTQPGLLATGGTLAHGAYLRGGGTSGSGLFLESIGGSPAFRIQPAGTAPGVEITTADGDGITIAPQGTDRHGIRVTGGTGGTSDGINVTAGTGGVDIRGNLTGNITGNLSGSAGSVTAPVTVGTNNDKTGYRLSATGVDDVLDEAVEGTTTLRQSIRLANSANGGKVAGATPGTPSTVTVRDLADSKDRISADVDANGNRTAVTLDVT